MRQEKSPGLTPLPNRLTTSYVEDVRRVFEIQEHNVLSGSFGATVVQAEEGQAEAQSCDGKHAYTSRSSR